MSEADQAEGGIVIKDKRLDFETCEEINLFESNVRLLSLSGFMMLHDVRCAPGPITAAHILASRR
jgi:hypothetical protein